ncbi:MAG TPA: DUF4194 domain-containing protein [Verrucomicrobiae bacterium]
MTPVWPSFWANIPDGDRPALREILAELLTTGVLMGESGRERELFLTARKYQLQLSEYLAPLNLNLFQDPDRPLLQARPVPGECGLTARFTKDETLAVLTLWRFYDDARMERPAETVIVSANDLYARLKLYFEHIEPPANTHLERILAKLRSKRLIRFQKDEERFGESRIEILPTLARAIPFERAEEWAQTVNGFKQAAGEEAAEAGAESEARP